MTGQHSCRLFLLAGILLLAAVCFPGWRGDGRTSVSETELAPETAEHPRAALTFDDGPNRQYTERLLDGLQERNIRASFFLMGKNIAGCEDLVRRMHEEGHLIGNHTYDHVDLSRVSERDACDQIQRTSNAIYEITGQYTAFVRPPYGEWREGLDCAVTMMPVRWTVDPLDWNTKDADLVVRRVEKAVKDEDIILLHDCSASSVEAALRIADDLTGQGYEFVTVDELLME